MEKTILELLKAKFEGVSDKILSRIAAKIAKTAKTEDEANAAVEAYTLQQLIDSNGDFRADEASTTAVKNYEKKHGLKDGQKVKSQTTEDDDDDDDDDDDASSDNKKKKADDEKVPAWAQSLMNELKAMKGEKVEASRRSKLNELIKDLPESVRKAYARTPVKDLSDDEFDALTEEIKGEVEEIGKEDSGSKTVFGIPRAGSSNQKKATDAEVTAIVDKMNI